MAHGSKLLPHGVLLHDPQGPLEHTFKNASDLSIEEEKHTKTGSRLVVAKLAANSLKQNLGAP